MPLQLLLEIAALVIGLSGLSLALEWAGIPANRLLKSIGIFFAIFAYLKYRVYPPMTFTMLATYLLVIFLAILLWASSSEKYWNEFRQPIVTILDAESAKTKHARNLLLISLPILSCYLTWNALQVRIEEPVELRTVHPAIPDTVIVHGQTIEQEHSHNPFLLDAEGHVLRDAYKEYVNAAPWGEPLPLFLRTARDGGIIYFQECVLCHGANLDGRGIFGSAFNPYPISFTSLFKVMRPLEADMYIRIAKGGAWLPAEGFPWASTMPAMEEHLSAADIWKVTLFLYSHTGKEPYWGQ